MRACFDSVGSLGRLILAVLASTAVASTGSWGGASVTRLLATAFVSANASYEKSTVALDGSKEVRPASYFGSDEVYGGCGADTVGRFVGSYGPSDDYVEVRD